MEEHEHHEHEHDEELRSRLVGYVDIADGEVFVNHVYGSGLHEHDPGIVGLTVRIDDTDAVRIDGTEAVIGIIAITAENALLLANRLTRAAGLVLETDEQPADLDREVARLKSDAGAGGED